MLGSLHKSKVRNVLNPHGCLLGFFGLDFRDKLRIRSVLKSGLSGAFTEKVQGASSNNMAFPWEL